MLMSARLLTDKYILLAGNVLGIKRGAIRYAAKKTRHLLATFVNLLLLACLAAVRAGF